MNALLEQLTAKSLQNLGTYLDVQEVFGQHTGAIVDGHTGAVELTTQHFGGDWHFEHIASEFDVGLQVVDIRGTFEDLKRNTGLNGVWD